MYSFPNLEPVHCSMPGFNCWCLTCTQISQEASQVVWYSHLFMNFPQFVVIHTVKGLGIVNKADIDVFLELSCFLDESPDVGNLISDFSAFSKFSFNIWMFSIPLLLKLSLEDFEHDLASMWNACNCVVVWTFFGIALWLEWKLTFSNPVATAEFSTLAGILSTHYRIKRNETFIIIPMRTCYTLSLLFFQLDQILTQTGGLWLVGL